MYGTAAREVYLSIMDFLEKDDEGIVQNSNSQVKATDFLQDLRAI